MEPDVVVQCGAGYLMLARRIRNENIWFRRAVAPCLSATSNQLLNRQSKKIKIRFCLQLTNPNIKMAVS
jgi:hypothetical protein